MDVASLRQIRTAPSERRNRSRCRFADRKTAYPAPATPVRLGGHQRPGRAAALAKRRVIATAESYVM